MDSRKNVIDRCRHFVLDMDGTFYLGSRVLDGSLDFLEAVKRTGRDFMFFTNNSSRSPEVYIQRLGGMNCQIDKSQIMTSGDVTIEFLKSQYPGKKVYLVGTSALEQSFLESGINLVTEGAEVAVVGFDTTLTYEKLTRVCDYVRNGAVYIATHPDINCPVENGFIPDVGSFIALIASSTGGKKPRILGKPNRETVDMVVQRTGWKKEEIAFVGDRIYTDVATGVCNGANGILVLSGESDMNTVALSEIKPDAIFENLGEMIQFM